MRTSSVPRKNSSLAVSICTPSNQREDSHIPPVKARGVLKPWRATFEMLQAPEGSIGLFARLTARSHRAKRLRYFANDHGTGHSSFSSPQGLRLNRGGRRGIVRGK